MTTAATPPDLRPLLRAAQERLAQTVDGITPDQMHAPTPCEDFDVTQLLEHVVAVEHRLERFPAGAVADDMPESLPLPDGDLAAALREASARALDQWDDESLTRAVHGPTGPVPGAVLIAMYLMEHVAHTWDLAVATGQEAEVDPALAEAAMATARQGLPPQGRGDLPFGEPVEAAPGAGPTERLAAYLGRQRP